MKSNSKHFLRLLAGRTLRLVGLTEMVRKTYYSHGFKFLRGLGNLQGSWFRRSIVSSDFVPVLSDIDLTLLLNSAQIEHLFTTRQLKRRPALLQDIQLVYEPFLSRWLRTGGLRNRQIQSWIPTREGIHLSPPFEHSKDILAFEIAHELYLLYKQLVPKLSLPYRDESAAKLFFELNRLMIFWSSGNEAILCEPRSKFAFNLKESESVFFKDLNSLCTDLLSKVDPLLSEIHPEKLILESGPGWTLLNLKMENRFIRLASAEDLSQTAMRFPNDFVTTREFVALSLGVGIQDQPQLNQLAWKESGYYRDFCTQRLAHDLIGSILLHPDNFRQLYFCFKNIDEFLKGFPGIKSFGWERISSWTYTEPFPLGNEEALRHAFRNLELLESIR